MGFSVGKTDTYQGEMRTYREREMPNLFAARVAASIGLLFKGEFHALLLSLFVRNQQRVDSTEIAALSNIPTTADGCPKDFAAVLAADQNLVVGFTTFKAFKSGFASLSRSAGSPMHDTKGNTLRLGIRPGKCRRASSRRTGTRTRLRSTDTGARNGLRTSVPRPGGRAPRA
jgi:hypothetical protein